MFPQAQAAQRRSPAWGAWPSPSSPLKDRRPARLAGTPRPGSSPFLTSVSYDACHTPWHTPSVSVPGPAACFSKALVASGVDPSPSLRATPAPHCGLGVRRAL